jgi:hypothetical protein
VAITVFQKRICIFNGTSTRFAPPRGYSLAFRFLSINIFEKVTLICNDLTLPNFPFVDKRLEEDGLQILWLDHHLLVHAGRWHGE